MIPKYYGIAYRDFASKTTICYPIPLNIAVAYNLRLMLFLRFGLAAPVHWTERTRIAERRALYYLNRVAELESQVATEYIRGRNSGYQHGYQVGYERAFGVIEAQLEAQIAAGNGQGVEA